jgi:hypothetical protein
LWLIQLFLGPCRVQNRHQELSQINASSLIVVIVIIVIVIIVVVIIIIVVVIIIIIVVVAINVWPNGSQDFEDR